MALSIKNAETERLARELAARTGQSVTEAVTAALRSRLGELASTGRERERRLESLRRIVDDAAGRWPEHLRQVPHGDLLYDERGLPR